MAPAGVLQGSTVAPARRCAAHAPRPCSGAKRRRDRTRQTLGSLMVHPVVRNSNPVSQGICSGPVVPAAPVQLAPQPARQCKAAQATNRGRIRSHNGLQPTSRPLQPQGQPALGSTPAAANLHSHALRACTRPHIDPRLAPQPCSHGGRNAHLLHPGGAQGSHGHVQEQRDSRVVLRAPRRRRHAQRCAQRSARSAAAATRWRCGRLAARAVRAPCCACPMLAAAVAWVSEGQPAGKHAHESQRFKP